MTDFETALEDCLKRMSSGEADVEACLALYPEHAEQLRPLLKAANRFKSASQVRPSSTIAPGTKPADVPYIEVDPRSRRRGIGWYLTPGVRWAIVAIVVVVALFLTVTAYAQTSYPGDALYGLKLASEDALRLVTPVQLDIWLSHRRAAEVLAVRDDPRRLAIAWAQYKLIMERLMAYQDPSLKDQIQSVLRAEWDALVQAGIPLPTGQQALPPIPTVTPTPTLTVTPLPPGLVPSLAPSATATPTTGLLPAPSSTPKNGALPTVSFPTLTPAPTITSGPSPTFPFPSKTAGPSPTFPFPTPCPSFPFCP